MENILKVKNLNIFIFSVFWSIFWLSINTMPFEIYLFGKSILQSINSLRLVSALIISILLISFTLCSFSLKNVSFYYREYNATFLFLLLFSTYFLSLIFNENRSFNLDNIYLIILSYGTIFLFFSINSYIEKNLKFFLKINIFFLFLICCVILLPKLEELIDNNYNFYLTFEELDGNILKQVNPRITGLSRSFAILGLFILALYFDIKNLYFKLITFLIFILFNFIIISMESRGTLLCFTLSTLLVVLFLNKSRIGIKFLLITILLITNISFSQIYSKNQININNEIDESRLLSTNTSGRIEIWSHIIKHNNYGNILGLGSQGDRFFLENFKEKKIFGNNSSNSFFYVLLSGGYAGLFFLLMIYINLTKKVLKGMKLEKYNLYYTFSLSIILFFLIRSFFENSFVLISIDYLLIFSSILYIDTFHANRKIKYEN